MANHGKSWKIMENHGKSWQIMENPDQVMSIVGAKSPRAGRSDVHPVLRRWTTWDMGWFTMEGPLLSGWWLGVALWLRKPLWMNIKWFYVLLFLPRNFCSSANFFCIWAWKRSLIQLMADVFCFKDSWPGLLVDFLEVIQKPQSWNKPAANWKILKIERCEVSSGLPAMINDMTASQVLSGFLRQYVAHTLVLWSEHGV